MTATPRVTVAIPTLARQDWYLEAARSIALQSLPGVVAVVIDNSGSRRVRANPDFAATGARLLEPSANLGFGAAVNLAWRTFPAEFAATLNDDAVAHPDWLRALCSAAEQAPDIGMCASAVHLAGTGRLDSAGMCIARDGSSKQRGHNRPPEEFPAAAEVLCPSGSAALYRWNMLQQIGLFEEDFFLYCEDTDLGLRARRAGWRCVYEPSARVDHRYSASSGRSTALKAFYVERNRLGVVARNFPLRDAILAPFWSIVRYLHHLAAIRTGQGRTAEIHAEGHSAFRLAMLVAKSHLAAARSLPRWRQDRARIAATARISSDEFSRLLRHHRISLREVAAL